MFRRMFPLATALLIGVVSVAGCGSSKPKADSPGAVQAAIDAADFGSLKNICHKATSPNKANSDRGVTATSIQITTISDAGSTLQPGLDQELWDTGTVFTNWCNDHGGINGRQILMTKGDAQVLNYQKAIDTACNSAFALVGGGGALDNTGVDDRLKCLLPDVPGFSASAQARAAALSFSPNPSPINQFAFGDLQYLAQQHGTKQNVVTVYGDFDTTKFTRAQAMIAATSGVSLANRGPEVQEGTLDFGYPPTGQSDWTATAQDIKKSGATGVIFVGQPGDLAKLLNSMLAVGATNVKWVDGASNLYDQTLITNARAALNTFPVYVPIYVTPFEVASIVREDHLSGASQQIQAIQEYEALFEKYLPNGKVHAMLGLNAFAAWLLFAQSANECGANLTRKCLVTNIQKVTQFNAGGLTAPRNPANQGAASQCFALMKATRSGFDAVNIPKTSGSTTNGVFTCNQNSVYVFTGTEAILNPWNQNLPTAVANQEYVNKLP